MTRRALSAFVLSLFAPALLLAAGTIGPKAKAPFAVRPDETPMVAKSVEIPAAVAKTNVGPGDSLLFTTYDYGSNGATNHNIVNFGDGTLAIGRMAAVLAASADRGTWYSYYDGTSWRTAEKVEAARRGWSNISAFPDAGFTEVTVSHTGLRVNVHDSKGGTSWVEFVTGSTAGSTWPKAAAGGETYLHMVAASAGSGPANTDVFYTRSADGGGTFDKVDVPVPTTTGSSAADGYDIAAKGAKVALLVCGSADDVVLLTSEDNGDTWTETVVYDVRPGAELPAGAIEEQSDGSGAVIFDNAGNPHVVWGTVTAIGDSGGLTYYGLSNSIMYWSAATGVKTIATTIQDPALLNFAGSPGVDGGYVTSPDIAVDAANKVYVTYMQSMTEVDPDSGFNYTHIFGLGSPDGGATWGSAKDLTPFTGLDATWPSIADLVDANVHMVYYADVQPGNAIQGSHPENTTTAVKYWAIPAADFFTTDVKPLDGVPSSFVLAQNYPNPFNPSTKIQYAIPAGSFVTLKVYDMLGREVATLVNQEQAAGVYEATFDASNLANGAYVYSLKAGGFSQVKTMMLLK
jgi:hypothetical protein